MNAVQGTAKKVRATMALFQGFIGKDGPNVAWIVGMDCGMKPRNQQAKKALGKCFFALPCSAVSSITSSVY